jgi:hypothetical protein
MKAKIEYSIIGNKIDEHFENKIDAEEFFEELTKKQKKMVQFFSKEWLLINGEWTEGEVILFN